MSEIDIIGSIGWDVTVSDISRQIKDAAPGPLAVHINSPGGAVFDGIAIATMLRRHGDVTAYIDGLAASAASVIAIGAQKRIMAPGTLLMIHNPWSFAGGNAGDLRKEADVLDVIAGEVAKLYADASGGALSVEKARELMDAETWFTAEQAMEYGLVHAVEGQAKALASIDPKRHNYHNIPKGLLMEDTITTPTPKAGLLETIMAKIGGSSEALAAKESEIATIRAELTEASAALVDAAAKLAEAKAETETARSALSAKDAEIETIKADHAAALVKAEQDAVAKVLAGSAPAPLSHAEPDPSEAPLERYNRLHAEGKKAEAFAFYEANGTEIDKARRVAAGKE